MIRNSLIALAVMLALMALDPKTTYDWWKSFHIIMMTSWFAGLFYLPRIYVNLAMVPQDQADTTRAEYDRLMLMANKLLRFMTPLAVLTLASGSWLWLGYGVTGGWMHVKLLAVVLLVIYHGLCIRHLQGFGSRHPATSAGAQSGDQTRGHSHIWYRWFNEVPVLLLILVVIMVVVKPF